jgi:protein TonB
VPAAPPGPDPTAGAASAPGPGSGLDGAGDGSGAGTSGIGPGGGGRARWLSGAITPRDYPRGVSRAGLGGSVTVALEIDADGRVTGCRVTESSGLAELNETTCRLIRARFRYRPATDAAGNPVPGRAAWRQDWWLEPRRGGDVRASGGS